MTKSQDAGFKKTLRRMLSTGPIPHETNGKKRKNPNKGGEVGKLHRPDRRK